MKRLVTTRLCAALLIVVAVGPAGMGGCSAGQDPCPVQDSTEWFHGHEKCIPPQPASSQPGMALGLESP